MSQIPMDKLQSVGGSQFLVHIMFRQNASWQGELQWLESDQKVYFRSLLELIELMQEAMEAADNPQADYRLRSWKEEGELKPKELKENL